MLNKYVIERNIPKVGGFDQSQLRDAARTSNAALDKLAGKVEWVESFVTADKTYCVYLADTPETVKRHAELSGFPANVITQVETMFGPSWSRA
ncbi:MAG: DUF4242 domain-containing protein [Devosia sp.]